MSAFAPAAASAAAATIVVRGFRDAIFVDKGSFADVYRAVREEDKKVVALKRVRMRLDEREGDLVGQKVADRAREEYERVNALGRHPNVVQPLGCTMDQDRHLVVVMEFAENGSASARMKGSYGGRPAGAAAGAGARASGGLFSSSDATFVALDVGNALAFIHERSVVHRDVKPGNIVFDGENRALLADFGSAKVLEAGREAMGGSTQGKGTPGYSAPEVLAKFPATAASDVWSLGVTLLDLVSGCGELAKDESKVSQDLNAEYTLLRLLGKKSTWTLETALTRDQRAAWDKVDEGLRLLVASCLAVDPSLRPTAAQLLETACLREAAAKREMEDRVVRPLRWEIKTKDDKIMELEASLKVANETVAKQVDKIAELKGTIKTKDKKIAQLNASLVAANATIREQQGKIASLEGSLEAASKTIAELREDNEAKEKTIKSQDLKIEELKKRVPPAPVFPAHVHPAQQAAQQGWYGPQLRGGGWFGLPPGPKGGRPPFG